MLASHLKHSQQAVDANLPCQQRLLFGHHREQGGEVVDGVHVVAFHYPCNVFGASHVGQSHRTAVAQFALGFLSGDVASHYMTAAVDVPELARQLRAYLAR